MASKSTGKSEDKSNDPSKDSKDKAFRRPFSSSPVSSSDRLPSIKKRDLTLCTSSKKTFTPTIPNRRVKKEAVSTEDVKVNKQTKEVKYTSKQGRGRGQRGRGRGREVITSSSIFSMGPAERRKSVGGVVVSHPASMGGPRQSRTTTTTRPTPGGRGGVKDGSDTLIHDDNEPMDFSESGDHMDPFEDSSNPPILLPLDYSLHGIKEKMAAHNIKQKSKLIPAKLASDTSLALSESKPPVDDLKADVSGVQVGVSSPQVGVSDAPVGVSISELFSRPDDPRAKLLLLQLPDVLATGEKCVPLSEIKESGFVGKLKVHKSGKVRLHLGSTVLDVTMGTPCSFRQDVVTMDTDKKELVHLGVLSHKVVCAPNFDHLLQEA